MKNQRFRINPISLDGFKSRENWIAEALGAKWTNRQGYTVASQARAEQFTLFVKFGVDCDRRYLSPLKGEREKPRRFYLPGSLEPLTAERCQALLMSIQLVKIG